jgi:hypothetical protein
MNFAVAKCALGSTHWLEVKKIHICQCLRAGFRALAVEWDGVGESVEFSLFFFFRIEYCTEHSTILVFYWAFFIAALLYCCNYYDQDPLE